MKQFLALLCALAFALPCSSGTTDDIFSPIPAWVSRTTLHDDVRWVSVTERKYERRDVPWYERDLKESTLFQIPKSSPRLELLLLKAHDPRLGMPPTDRDYDKHFTLPSSSDASNIFERSNLRFRPSWMLDEKWRLSIPKAKQQKDQKGKKSLVIETTLVRKF